MTGRAVLDVSQCICFLSETLFPFNIYALDFCLEALRSGGKECLALSPYMVYYVKGHCNTKKKAKFSMTGTCHPRQHSASSLIWLEYFVEEFIFHNVLGVRSPIWDNANNPSWTSRLHLNFETF